MASNACPEQKRVESRDRDARLFSQRAFLQVERLRELGYPEKAAHRLIESAGGELKEIASVETAISGFGYHVLPPEGDYSRSVVAAAAAGEATCLEASLLAYDLAGLLNADRRLMVMTRLDPKTRSYLGHSALIYREQDARSYGAISLSRHRSQRCRPASYTNAEAVALSYAEGYVELGLVPLCFGIVDLDRLAAGLDWRRVPRALQELEDRLLDQQVFHLEIEVTRP